MAITRTKIGNLWFNYRGEYDSSATYKKDDIVIWNNTDYLNIRESSVSGKQPEQNTQYYYNIQTTTDPSDSTTKFQIDADETSTIEWAQTLYVRRGDKIIFHQNNNNNDDQPLAIATSATSQTSNYLTTGVTYYHNEETVTQADYVTTSKFNTKTSRKVVVEFDKDTPSEIWYFSAGTGGANGTHTGIAIKGDGTGGVVSVVVTSGAVTAVNVTSAGTGYTFGTISNAQIVSAGATNLVGAELDVIIPPKGGHGKNAVEELGGFFVMLNTSLEGTESGNSGDVTVANDFRKISLIRDPLASGSAATATTLRGTKAINLSGVSGSYVVDEKITQATTGAVGKVVEYDSTNKLLYYIQTRHNDEGVDSNGNQTAFSGNNVITGAGGATGTPTSNTKTLNSVSLTSGYSASEIDADSGDILYIENRAPITRAADQTENIKLVIEF